ncbi:MAG: hypothetical protein OXF20_10695 [Gammaproteobacteria bacterium]|nr:hypothetical protein [Gammaproteobacteria bacterium]
MKSQHVAGQQHHVYGTDYRTITHERKKQAPEIREALVKKKNKFALALELGLEKNQEIRLIGNGKMSGS